MPACWLASATQSHSCTEGADTTPHSSLTQQSFSYLLYYNSSLLPHSDVLKGNAFDRDCVSQVINHMKSHGVTFMPAALPLAFSKTSASGASVSVKYKSGSDVAVAEYDTVLIATGRCDIARVFYHCFCQLNVLPSGTP